MRNQVNTEDTHILLFYFYLYTICSGIVYNSCDFHDFIIQLHDETM